jgi:hypothetical protein
VTALSPRSDWPEPFADPAVQALLRTTPTGGPGAVAASALQVEYLVDAPYTGVGDGPAAVLAAADWCHTGPAGATFAVVRVPEGFDVRAGDADGLHPIEPPIRGAGLYYSWRPDGRGVMLHDRPAGVHHDVDLTERTARPVLTGADDACHTAEGLAALVGDDLVLYGPPADTGERPTELGRVRLPALPSGEAPAGAHHFGWADDGRVLHLTQGGRTVFLAVAGGRVYPIGAFAAADWFLSWSRDGALYLQNQADGTDFRAVRVTGFASAVPAALVGPAIEVLELDRFVTIGTDRGSGSPA